MSSTRSRLAAASAPATARARRSGAPRRASTGATPRDAEGSQRRVFKEPRSVLEAFLVTVVRLAGARAGAVRALTADSDEPQLIAAWGVPAEALESELESCDNWGGARGCELGDVARPDSPDDAAPGANCVGTVAIPLEYKGSSVGVCTLFFDEVNSLRAEVIHLLRPVGQLLGLALENAKLERERMQSRLIEERQAMAGEIHDSLAQSLTFVRMRMPLLAGAIERNETERAARYCDDVTGELGSVNRRLRELVTHFRAGMDGQGLEQALENTARSFHDDSGIRLTLENEARGLDLDAESQVQVFRIVQEALANVRKHSNARHARVRLGREGRELLVSVEDDGRGIPPGVGVAKGRGRTSTGGHFGIEIMRERASAVGGRLEIGDAPGGGTLVTLALPARGSAGGAR